MVKFRSLISVCICVIVLLIIPFCVSAQDWWESDSTSEKTDKIVTTSDMVGENKVIKTAARSNWENGYIEVMAGATADMSETLSLGHAYSIATKTARHLAYEKLAETVTGLNLFSDATYDRELMIDSNLRTVLRAMIKNAVVVNETQKQFNDGSIWVEVTLGMKMFTNDGLIKPSVAWADRFPVKINPPPEPITEPATVPVPPPLPATTEQYTGLVIDATGLGANPAMLPKIYSVDGTILYGTQKIDKEYIIRYGLMGYKSNIQDAKLTDRVGKHPLVVHASGIKGKNKTDFIISSLDEARIKQALEQIDFFNECRVIAVLN